MIGDVEIGENASIWYGVVLRGDVDKIKIGANTSIQDNAVAHCATDQPTIIGDNCVVGHNAIIHSCVVEEGCLIGHGLHSTGRLPYRRRKHCGSRRGGVAQYGDSAPFHGDGRARTCGAPADGKDTEGITLSVGHYIAYAQEQLPKYHI